MNLFVRHDETDDCPEFCHSHVHQASAPVRSLAQDPNRGEVSAECFSTLNFRKRTINQTRTFLRADPQLFSQRAGVTLQADLMVTSRLQAMNH